MISLFQVQGKSMEPELFAGDVVLCEGISPLIFPLRKGDRIVFKQPGTKRMLIKSIEKAEAGNYWVQGVNKKQSTDSRNFGWVGKSRVLGRARVIHKTSVFAQGIMAEE